jgi:hypothetical protein
MNSPTAPAHRADLAIDVAKHGLSLGGCLWQRRRARLDHPRDKL